MGFKFFKILVGVEIVLLFIQFWLGMSINLSVKLPLYTALSFSSYSGGTEVLAHIINGILILGVAGVILSYGYRLKRPHISALSAPGAVFAVVAVATGATFALRGQDDSLSLTMAMSFIIIYTIYLSQFYLSQRNTKIT